MGKEPKKEYTHTHTHTHTHRLPWWRALSLSRYISIYIYIKLIQFVAHLKLTQYCQSTILQ